ncbi:hypothetical protein KKE92_04230 [Candidatus Micrarchaeota archaeon]|nr:hypothetical protein [Candidatus Micrarchaeota archaeon]MBU1682305.1 hypothetical protein [Candidatus Micrarchaeota archaeon]
MKKIQRTIQFPKKIRMALVALPLVSALACTPQAECPERTVQTIITAPCECEPHKCEPCETAKLVSATLSEKLDAVSASVRDFGSQKRSFADHMRFFDNSSFDDGTKMFPGLAKTLRECPYLESNEIRFNISKSLIQMFDENPQKLSNVFQLIEKMPMTIVVQIASLEYNVGDKNRIKLRRRLKSRKLTTFDRMDSSANFLLSLGNALENGDGAQKRTPTPEDWKLLDRDVASRILHWPVKLWWVNDLQVWDVAYYPDHLARYVCARMRTNFHKTIDGFGKNCPSHLYHLRKQQNPEITFEQICSELGIENCPTEPLAAL